MGKDNKSRLIPVAAILFSTLAQPVAITPDNFHTWQIEGVSTMKYSKDRVCNQLKIPEINKLIADAKNLGATHISLETPYDNPSCGNAVAYTKEWIDAAKNQGINVIHRHMFTKFEGIYDKQKNNKLPYPEMIYKYITDHPDFFQDGDMVQPMPEPDNSGIEGFNCNSNCFFKTAEDFNKFIRDIYTSTKQALKDIGKENVVLSCCSFSGFTAAGLDNPDWQDGILEKETLEVLGNVVSIDHYPQGNATMQSDMDELVTRHPNWIIDIGEWGAIKKGENPVSEINETMPALKRPEIRSVTYWHIGPVGNGEGLTDEKINPLPPFYAVQTFFKPKP
jgi:hypothetical protein